MSMLLCLIRKVYLAKQFLETLRFVWTVSGYMNQIQQTSRASFECHIYNKFRLCQPGFVSNPNFCKENTSSNITIFTMCKGKEYFTMTPTSKSMVKKI